MLDPFKEIEKEYNLKYPYMYKFLYRLTSDKELIHDIIQDVFLSIIRKPDILADVRNRNAWFIQLSKNRYIDYLRKKSEVLIDDEYFFNSIKSSNLVEHQISQNELIEESLSLLSPEDREYVLAKYYFGYSYEEISEIANKSISSIKLRVFRAKKLILERMNPDE